MQLLLPPRLKKGDTIGLVAPCLPLLPDSRSRYELGVKTLKRLGFTIKEGKTIHAQHWWSGGTPEQQGEDIMALFSDPEVAALMAISGGFSAIRVLDKLDYSVISRHPKPFIGMSDMTAYHLALYKKIGLVGFHMDEVCFGLGRSWQEAEPSLRQTIEQAFVASLTNPLPIGNLPSFNHRKPWRSGNATGRLIGGNLNTLTRQLATSYFPSLDSFDNAIFFWEAVGLKRYEISQMLYQLKYAGIFDRISAMLIGTISAVKPAMEGILEEPSTKEVILEVLSDYDFPIMAGMEFGHFTPNLPMLIGTRVRIDATQQSFAYLEAGVR